MVLPCITSTNELRREKQKQYHEESPCLSMEYDQFIGQVGSGTLWRPSGLVQNAM